MAAHSHAFDSSPFASAHSHAQSPWREENVDSNDAFPSRPLSGPGTSRQTRRLQLRNAGFRGTAVPTRKVTPKSISSSTNWSNASGLVSGSDAENQSPSGHRTSSVKVEKRRSSGILQEIGNSATLTRPKKSSPRMSASKLFAAEASNYDGVYADSPLSPPPVRGTIKAKSAKSRTKAKPVRRSVSGEARMYIDHLEAELASAQSQLQALNSPTVTREQTSKMRTLNQETRQLQEELAEWEAKYDSRIQEVLDEHLELETGLKQQIKKLEEDADEARYMLEDMQVELDSTNQNMEAVEAANVQLEKRLEIMSEILASSPSKLDLHAVTPGMNKKHQRPKSMLPRFPTASSLVASPERQPRTQPPSPMLTFTDTSQAALDALEGTLSQSEMASDAESVFSEAPTNGNSMTSLEEHADGLPNFNPWTLQALQSAKARPARRMRRFGPGSHGPKALILPSTSGCELVPSSAPPLERSETTPAFSFPLAEKLEDEEDSPSAAVARRRASTTADETTLARLASSPFLQLPDHHHNTESEEVSKLSLGPPVSTESDRTSRDFSSLGSVAGRNLMAELCAVDTNGTAESGEELSRVTEEPTDEGEETMLVYGEEVEEGVDVHSVLSADNAAALPSHGEELSAKPSRNGSIGHSKRRSTSTSAGLSTWDRLRLLFADLWRSPVALARHLVQSAQARITIPAPLRSVQWWLVGVLLGPMARRRMLATPDCCTSSDLERQPLLQAYSPPQTAEDTGLVYGTMYHTPPVSPARSVSLVAGKGKKRASVEAPQQCKHHQHWKKHSPWMWLKFSITLAFAVGVAFKDGPASLLSSTVCGCRRKAVKTPERERSEASGMLC